MHVKVGRWVLPWLSRRILNKWLEFLIPRVFQRNLGASDELSLAGKEGILINGEAMKDEVKVIELMQSGQSITVEGLPLEKIAAWCFTYHYRWRFCPDSASASQLKFIMEPGVKPTPPDHAN